MVTDRYKTDEHILQHIKGLKSDYFNSKISNSSNTIITIWSLINQEVGNNSNEHSNFKIIVDNKYYREPTHQR